jgi:hypothetical protein
MMGLSTPPLDPNLKDWVQAASWIAAVAAGLFGIIKIVIELRHARAQRQQELRWRKAQAAKSLNDEMLSDEGSHTAMTLLDWDGREFEIKQDVRAKITTEEMLGSLRTVNTRFSDLEVFVRDAFDNFFYYMGIFEHSTVTGLADFPDLEYPIEYYVAILAKNRPVFENYLVTYGFKRGLSFLGRFEPWRVAKALQQSPPNRAMQPTGSAGG